jgi:hypothetical protein
MRTTTATLLASSFLLAFLPAANATTIDVPMPVPIDAAITIHYSPSSGYNYEMPTSPPWSCTPTGGSVTCSITQPPTFTYTDPRTGDTVIVRPFFNCLSTAVHAQGTGGSTVSATLTAMTSCTDSSGTMGASCNVSAILAVGVNCANQASRTSGPTDLGSFKCSGVAGFGSVWLSWDVTCTLHGSKN